jgi:hypothetical protein
MLRTLPRDPPGATPSDASRRACDSSGNERTENNGGRGRGFHHLERVAQEAETRHVGRRVDLEPFHRLDAPRG